MNQANERPESITNISTVSERERAQEVADQIRVEAQEQGYDWQTLSARLKASTERLKTQTEWVSNPRDSILRELLDGGEEHGYPPISAGETRWLRGWRSSKFPQTGDHLEMSTTLSKVVAGKDDDVIEVAVAIGDAVREWNQLGVTESLEPAPFDNEVKLAQAASILYAASCCAQKHEHGTEAWISGSSLSEPARIASQEQYARAIQQKMEEIAKSNAPD